MKYFFAMQRTTALLLALLVLGSLLVLSPRPEDTTVLFGACCDESICSKYAIQKCAHTTGGKQDKEEREINSFLKEKTRHQSSSAEKSSGGSRGRAAHYKSRRGPEQHWYACGLMCRLLSRMDRMDVRNPDDVTFFLWQVWRFARS